MAGVSGGIPPYSYSLNEGPEAEFGSFENIQAGTHSLQIIDADGCVYDTLFSFEANTMVELTADPNIYHVQFGQSAEPLLLTNLDWTDVDTVIYEPNLFLSCDFCLDPSISAIESTEYTVTIIDHLGCSDTTQFRVIVDVLDLIYVPTIFTPDGDEDNDLFRIYPNEFVRKINNVAIYDRWGERMFSSGPFDPQELPFPQNGYWDGKFNGEHAINAVYVYFIEYETTDGETKVKVGDITLAR